MQPPSSLPSSFSQQSFFDPVLSINSGQVFLWERLGSSWYGVFGDHIIKFSKIKEDEEEDGKIEFLSYPEIRSCERKIFRLDDDIKQIFAEISCDRLVRKLLRTYPGLRLMRQEPHQCIFSFVCASNTNIPMIRLMLRRLSRRFGTPVKVDGIEFFSFPSADRINKATVDELRACGLGYRVKAIKAVAESIVNGGIDIDYLKTASYDRAKEELLQVYGIGNKTADCVLLFSLEKLDAFPIDVWIARALARYYCQHDDDNRLLPNKKMQLGDKIKSSYQYERVSKKMRSYFGKYAGYAQQYLYYHMRHTAGKKW